MVMGLPRVLVTAEELARMPDDDYSYELLEGRLVRMSKSGVVHGVCSQRLGYAVDNYLRAHDIGVVLPQDTGFLLHRGPDTVRAPDMAFIIKERFEAAGFPDGFWPGAPDLVVEVISPNDRRKQVEDKVRQWLESGTRLAWIVDPRKHGLSVRRPNGTSEELGEDQDLDGEDLLPGFHLPLRELFSGVALREP
ncbi:MAG: Uma2 family endonuclease [Vicinamibacteraceae bacterium]